MTETSSPGIGLGALDWKWVTACTAIGTVLTALLGVSFYKVVQVETAPEVISKLNAERLEAEVAATTANKNRALEQTNLEGVRTALSEAQGTLAKARTDAAAAKEEHGSLNGQVQSLRTEADGLRSTLTQLKSEKSELETSIATLKRESTELAESKSGLNREAESLQGQVSSLRQELDTLKARHADQLKMLGDADAIVKARIEELNKGGAK